VRFLAELAGVARSRVRVVSGATARTKIVEVEGVTQEDLEARLGRGTRLTLAADLRPSADVVAIAKCWLVRPGEAHGELDRAGHGAPVQLGRFEAPLHGPLPRAVSTRAGCPEIAIRAGDAAVGVELWLRPRRGLRR
jgi:hypothetical protein